MNARVILEPARVELRGRAQVGLGSAGLSANLEAAKDRKNKQSRFATPDGFYLHKNTHFEAVEPIWEQLIGKTNDEHRSALRRRKRRLSPGGWLDPGGI